MFDRKKKDDKKKDKDDKAKVLFEEKRSSVSSEEGDGEEEDIEVKDTDLEVKAEEEEETAPEDKTEEEEEKDKIAEIRDQLQRLQAEFDNYRKRVQKERIETWSVAKRDLVMSLLPFIDDVERMIEWDSGDADHKSVLEGMKLASKKLMSILKEEGFENVEAFGKPFDPNFHEALLTEDVDDPEKDNIVGDVMVEGYLFKGILLRPSRVRVLKYRDEEDKAGDGELDQAEDSGEENQVDAESDQGEAEDES
jgi:molecular chaperone GrpE